MPFVRVLMLEGRTQQQKDAMFLAVTKALCDTIDCTLEQVRVVAEDWPKGDYSHAGVSALAKEAASAKEKSSSQ